MKKTLLLLASAAMLLVGCAKEQITENNVGEGLQTVSFTVGVESAVTKAVADNDGKAAKINHWVIQVIDSDNAVYHYKAEDGVVGEKIHTFDVPLIKGQTYDVLFWADTKGKYVVTDLCNVKRTDGLKANSDSLDAFSAVVEDFSTAIATQKQVTLKRPFAQLNVVFTDLKKLSETMGSDAEYAKFKPVDFVVKAKVPTTFNVLTQKAGAPAETALEMKATECYNPSGEENQDNYTKHEAKATLYMDYIFASTTKDIVDIDFSFVSKAVAIAHNFAAVPFQRNYRTNILGNLMSANAKWEVEVDPNWDSLDDGSKDYNVNYYEPSSITDAQNYIANNDNQKAKTVDLSKATITSDDIDDDGTIKFELTPTSPVDMVNFTLPEIPQEVIDGGCTGWKITYTDISYPTQNVNVTAPDGTSVTINAPNSHVTLNGELYEQVTATTSQSTLVVPAGVTVKNLIVKEGAVEIHGTVNHLTVTPEEGKTVCFRECEGLSAEVFSAIKGEGHDYIDSPMYTYELVGEKYNIYKLPVVAMIGEKEYPSLASAINAVKDNDIIVLTKEVENAVGLKVNTGKTFTVDFNGHTYTLNKPGAGSAGTEANAFQLLQGQKVTFKNGKIEVSPDNLTPATVGKNIKRLIQGYAELVLEDMVLDATNLYESNAQYVCSFNNQPVTLKGNTSIIGLREGFTAFDSDGNWDGYARCKVTIDTKGTIAGPIELGQGYIEINDVILLGAINLCTSCGASETEGQLDRITIKGGTFSVDPSAYVKSPYEVKENGDGTFSVVKGSLVMPTRPVYNYDESKVVSSQEGLNNAIKEANAGDIIYVGAGTYSLPGIPTNISVRAANNAVVTITTGTGDIASIPAGCTFDGLTFEMGNSNYHGFQHAGHIKMDYCTIKGLFFSYGNMTFYGCTFIQSAKEYSMWCYAGDCSYDYCTFNNNGKFLNVYNEGNSTKPWKVSMTNCLLNSSNNNKAVLNIKENCINGAELCFEVTIANCQVNDETMFPEKSGDISQGSLYVGGPLWQVDDRTESTIARSLNGTGVTVTLDGTVVYGKKAE